MCLMVETVMCLMLPAAEHRMVLMMVGPCLLMVLRDLKVSFSYRDKRINNVNDPTQKLMWIIIHDELLKQDLST